METKRSGLLHICSVAPLSTTKVRGEWEDGWGGSTGLRGDFG